MMIRLHMTAIYKTIVLGFLILIGNSNTLYSQSIAYPIPYSVTTIAGQIGSGYADGNGTNAIFNQPFGITVDSTGNVYVADQNNYVIRRISSSGVVTTIAGQAGISGSSDGIGTAALFGAVNGITIDVSGNLYVTDGTYNTVRKISAGTWNVTTLIKSTAGLKYPLGIAVDSDSNIYIADSGNYVIRKLTSSGTLSVYAGLLGQGSASPGHLSYPSSICLDKNGNLFVVDSLQSTICKISGQGILSIIGGFPGAPGFLDGALSNQASQFNNPAAICSDSSGNLYIVDGISGSIIREISTSNTVSTLAGSIIVGARDGTGGSATFSNAKGIASDASGNLYISNTGSNTIRKASPQSINAPPTITSNPSNQLATLGATFALNVIATGGGTLSYQWFLNGNALTNSASVSGAQTANLLVSNFSTNQVGQYTAIVTNNYGTVTSTPVYIQLPVAIVTQPQAQTVVSGSPATFSVTASGSSPAYQWSFNSIPIAGATSSSFTVQNVQASNIGYYSVSISNAVNTTNSLYSSLTLINPLITVQPVSSSILIGQSTTLSVSATGASLNYQWYFNGVAIPGATSSAYTIISAGSSNAGSYQVVISNSIGSVTSNAVQLSVGTSLAITNQPASQSIKLGGTLTLSVNTNALGIPITYQWYLNGTAIAGATSANYTIPSVSTLSAGSYTVNISSSTGTVISNAAQVSLIIPGYLTDISVLSMDGPGNQLLSIGFTNGGAGTSGAENLLIRAAGPALAAFGISNFLPDPSITLFKGNTQIATNDNWGSSSANIASVLNAQTTTGAFAYSPTTSLDAALVQALPSIVNGYTVQISGKGNATGQTIAEIYDYTPDHGINSPRLTNLSSLLYIPTNSLATAGFVIGGTTSVQVLIRVSGPTLAASPFNLTGMLADPMLKVFAGNSLIATNASWGGSVSITAANNSTGAFQFNSPTSKDSAVLLTLTPGSYSVQATSASGTTGVALIELYEVPTN